MGILRLITVEPVRFLLALTLSMQHEATRALVAQKICISQHNNTGCDGDSIQETNTEDAAIAWDDTATWCFYLDVSTNLLGALVSCVYGSSSDKFGRRRLLVLPSVGMILGSASSLVQLYYLYLPVQYLFVSSALMGLFGYYEATYIGTMSYICDITRHSDRSMRLGIMESFEFIGAAVGLVIASTLLLQYDALLFVITITILLQGAIFVYVYYWLKETVDIHFLKEENLEERCSPRSICADIGWSLRRTFMVYVIWRTENRRQLLLVNQTVGILSSLGSSGEVDLTLLYTTRPPLSWGVPTLLAYFSAKGMIKGVILALGMPLFFVYFSHWTVRLDMVIAMTTSLSTSASLVLMAFSYTTFMMMLVPVVGCLGGFPNSLISSIKCKLVEPNEFGALFACTMLIQTVCRVVGRLLFQRLYTSTLSVWPRLPILGMGVFFVMLLSIITYMWCLSGHLDKNNKSGAKQRLLTTDDGCEEEEIELFSYETESVR